MNSVKNCSHFKGNINTKVKLVKWHGDVLSGKMMSWWNGKLMKWQVDEMAGWWNGKLMKWQVDEMAS